MKQRIDKADVVNPVQQMDDINRFGAIVIVIDENNLESDFTIVGEDEISLHND